MSYQMAKEILFNYTSADYIYFSKEYKTFFEFKVQIRNRAMKYRIYKEDGNVYSY